MLGFDITEGANMCSNPDGLKKQNKAFKFDSGSTTAGSYTTNGMTMSFKCVGSGAMYLASSVTAAAAAVYAASF